MDDWGKWREKWFNEDDKLISYPRSEKHRYMCHFILQTTQEHVWGKKTLTLLQASPQ